MELMERIIELLKECGFTDEELKGITELNYSTLFFRVHNYLNKDYVYKDKKDTGLISKKGNFTDEVKSKLESKFILEEKKVINHIYYICTYKEDENIKFRLDITDKKREPSENGKRPQKFEDKILNGLNNEESKELLTNILEYFIARKYIPEDSTITNIIGEGQGEYNSTDILVDEDVEDGIIYKDLTNYSISKLLNNHIGISKDELFNNLFTRKIFIENSNNKFYGAVSVADVFIYIWSEEKQKQIIIPLSLKDYSKAKTTRLINLGFSHEEQYISIIDNLFNLDDVGRDFLLTMFRGIKDEAKNKADLKEKSQSLEFIQQVIPNVYEIKYKLNTEKLKNLLINSYRYDFICKYESDFKVVVDEVYEIINRIENGSLEHSNMFIKYPFGSPRIDFKFKVNGILYEFQIRLQNPSSYGWGLNILKYEE